MLLNNFHFRLVQIGYIQVTVYALVWIVSFLVCLYTILKAVEKREIKITKEQAYDLLIILMVGVITGARIFHVLFWDLSYYLSSPLKILYIWEGGLSFHGGFIGVVTVVYFYSKKNKISIWQIADLLILPITFVLALGRIANFLNQEIIGTITSVPWCVRFSTAEGCRHPVQIYASAGRFFLFFFLLTIKRYLKQFKQGFLFWSFVTLIGLGRFFLDFLREDTRYLALSIGQWFSILMVIIGIYVLITYYKQELINLLIKKIWKNGS